MNPLGCSAALILVILLHPTGIPLLAACPHWILRKFSYKSSVTILTLCKKRFKLIGDFLQ